MNKIKIIGELIKNIGLGLFVNGLYGVSDGKIELYNIIDMFLGLVMILFGIILENSKDEQC